MSVNDADGASDAIRARWDALREQYTQVLAENARVRDQALQARMEAVEQRLHFEAVRHGRDKAL